MKTCGYSEPCDYQRIHAAHLLKFIPKITDKFESGALNLTQIVQVQRCIKWEQHDSYGKFEESENRAKTLKRTEAILEKIEHCNGFQTKQILAKEFDLPIQHFEKILPQKDESVTTQMNFSKGDFETIQQLKSLMSHIVPDGWLAKIFTLLAKEKLLSKKGKPQESKLSLNKAKNVSVKIRDKGIERGTLAGREPEMESEIKTGLESEMKNATLGQSEAGFVSNNLTPRLTATEGYSRNRRIYISIRLKRELFQKAEDHCKYVSPAGQRCESTYQLQTDHRIPLALGGSNHAKNLRIICRVHNNLAARSFGLNEPQTSRAKIKTRSAQSL